MTDLKGPSSVFPKEFFQNSYDLSKQIPDKITSTERRWSYWRRPGAHIVGEVAEKPQGRQAAEGRILMQLRLHKQSQKLSGLIAKREEDGSPGLAEWTFVSLVFAGIGLYLQFRKLREEFKLIGQFACFASALSYPAWREPLFRRLRIEDPNYHYSLGAITSRVNQREKQWFNPSITARQLLQFGDFVNQVNTQVAKHNKAIDSSRISRVLNWALEKVSRKISLKWEALSTDSFLATFAKTVSCQKIVPGKGESFSTTLSRLKADWLRHLEPWLGKLVIAQDKAIEAIAKAMRRAELGLKDPNKPRAVLFFYGPTGTGKTQAAKATAELEGVPLVRFDMEQFKGSHSFTQLFGSPPSYVGSDKMGQLTGAVHKNPRCVLLIDEFEKAHPEVQETFMAIFDEGKAKDSSFGIEVDFSQCTIVLTSNATDLTQAFKPELRNRFSAEVGFEVPSGAELAEIVKSKIDNFIQLKKLQVKARFAYDPKLIDYLVQRANPQVFGIREVQRILEKDFNDQISEILIASHAKGTNIDPEDTIYFHLGENEQVAAQLRLSEFAGSLGN